MTIPLKFLKFKPTSLWCSTSTFFKADQVNIDLLINKEKLFILNAFNLKKKENCNRVQTFPQAHQVLRLQIRHRNSTNRVQKRLKISKKIHMMFGTLKKKIQI